MKVANYANAAIDLNVRLFGTDGNGIQKNYPFSEVLGVNNSIEVVTDNSLTEYSISSANTYFTGTTGASFEITLPEASSGIDTYKYVIMCTANRANVTWVSLGSDDIIGLPTLIEKWTPICVQYSHSDLTWYRSM
jgi:hypothetical protein